MNKGTDDKDTSSEGGIRRRDPTIRKSSDGIIQ